MPHPHQDPERAALLRELVVALPTVGIQKTERTLRSWLAKGGPREPLLRNAWNKAMATARRNARAALRDSARDVLRG